MNRRSIRRLIGIIAVSLAPLFCLAACNTIEGAGKDIQAGGRAIENAASDED